MLAVGDGTLTGSVTSPDAGAIDGEIEIYQWIAEDGYFDYWDSVYPEAEASPFAYSVEVPAGDYYLEFEDYTESISRQLRRRRDRAGNGPDLSWCRDSDLREFLRR